MTTDRTGKTIRSHKSLVHLSSWDSCHRKTWTHRLNVFFLVITSLLPMLFFIVLYPPCSLSAIRLVYSAYLRLLMFLQPVFIPACNSSSLAFLMMCSACRLNKQGDNRQPCCTPFPILNQLVVTYRVLTVVSWHTYRFLREQVRWSGIPISLRAFHSLLWSTQSKALA